MLETPPTLRLARADELSDYPEAQAKVQQASIEEGFLLKPNTDEKLPFEFFAVININNSRLWDLFVALCEQLPEEVSCRYGIYNDDLIYSEYIPLHKAMEVVGTCRQAIEKDCNLELGLVNSSDDALLEVHVSETKYISVWGMDEKGFRMIMDEFQLAENVDLHLIDEFPTIVTPLTKIDNTAKSTKNIVTALFTAFKNAETK